ncbi:MAG: YihY/virulence factor BrkB family protein [Blastocatellia bacterium]|nr:YihY/virulence factor BrkB family protein [Blastocatellia bacterium]
MAETTKINSTTERMGGSAETTPIDAPRGRGVGFYLRGGLVFFKKMWPAIFDLTETQTYVHASAIAFNIMLSFFSFVVLIGSFLVNVVNWQRGYETSFRLMMSLVPDQSASLFRSLDKVTRGPGGKATLLSFGLLIFSASGVFQPLEAALNRAWGFKERSVVKQYVTYLILVILCAAIILCPVAMASGYAFFLDLVIDSKSTIGKVLFGIVGHLVALPFIVMLLFVIYYIVPNGKVNGGQVFFTSIATAMLWVLTTLGFRLALPLFEFRESYEQLSSLMALVTWVFISSFILILGANLSAYKVLPEAWTGFLPFRRRVSNATETTGSNGPGAKTPAVR